MGLKVLFSEDRATGSFGTRPLVIIDDSETLAGDQPTYKKELAAFNEYWFHQLLSRLAALSTRSHLVLVKNPRAPETLIAAVREVFHRGSRGPAEISGRRS